MRGDYNSTGSPFWKSILELPSEKGQMDKQVYLHGKHSFHKTPAPPPPKQLHIQKLPSDHTYCSGH